MNSKKTESHCLSEEQIDALFTAEGSVDPESSDWQAHLDACPACQAQVALDRTLTTARAVTPPTLSADFQRNLRQRLQEEGLGHTPAERERKTLQRWAAWLSLGAWGLLALVLAGVADAVSQGTDPWSPALITTLVATVLLAAGPIPWLWRLRRQA